MKLWGVSEFNLRRIVEDVSRREYEGNITIRDISVSKSGSSLTFTLRCVSSRGPGAKRSIGFDRERRTVGACWHAHYDVMEEIFKQFPQARLQSGRIGAIDYRGQKDFYAKAPATADILQGPIVCSAPISSLCDCD